MGLIIGTAVEEVLGLIPQMYRPTAVKITTILILLASLPAAQIRAKTIEPYRHFVTEQDLVAMEWIKVNIPEDARFVINTYPWLPNFAHGTDAGYWIPYLTGHQIITSAMLSDSLPKDYQNQVIDWSKAAETLKTDLSVLETFYSTGTEYIYIGARGDFAGIGLQVEHLTQSDKVELLYQNGDTAVLRIHP